MFFQCLMLLLSQTLLNRQVAKQEVCNYYLPPRMHDKFDT